MSKSHTAAHLVHSSLRNILGDHVAQAGSHVAPGKFRFDFSHTDKVKVEELDDQYPYWLYGGILKRFIIINSSDTFNNIIGFL